MTDVRAVVVTVQPDPNDISPKIADLPITEDREAESTEEHVYRKLGAEHRSAPPSAGERTRPAANQLTEPPDSARTILR